jgi:cysteine desulfurase
VILYFDNLAATPIDPRVSKAHCEAMSAYPANGHSAEHSAGMAAQRAIDGAAESLLKSMERPGDDLLFTPGASAALWLAVEDCIARVANRPARIAASAAEHPALLSALKRADRSGRIALTIIDVDEDGAPIIHSLREALRTDPDLVCTMAANNEVGTISDLKTIGEAVSTSGARHLVDASQAAGKIPAQTLGDADLVVVSGAKIYGPRRTGALIGRLSNYARDLAHDIFGSPDTSSAIALARAMELRAEEREADESRLECMRDRLQALLEERVPGLRVNGALNSRLAGSLHVSASRVPGEAVVAMLYGRVAISTGAACQWGVPGHSHVLEAMRLPHWAREGAIRIGIGRFNSEEEIEAGGAMIAAALTASEPVRRRA